MRQPIQVLVYPVRRGEHGPEYLLLHRVLRGDDVWQGVTGGVEDDETPSVTARRELAEETGLVPARVEQIDFSYTFPLADKWRDLYAPGVEEIVEYVFVAWIDGEPEPLLSREHRGWVWLPVETALERLVYPTNREALSRCAAVVDARAWPGSPLRRPERGT